MVRFHNKPTPSAAAYVGGPALSPMPPAASLEYGMVEHLRQQQQPVWYSLIFNAIGPLYRYMATVC